MPLIDLATYKSLVGTQPGDTRDDTQITALLEPISKAIETYTGRSFAVSERRTTRRSFQYDGSGFLDIDDCTYVTTVEAVIPNADNYVLDAQEWTPAPHGGPTYYYIVMHGGISPWSISPEMGFKRNLDKYPPSRFENPMVNVTATWGWPSVPHDVKLATALTIKQFLTSQGGGAAEGLSAEAIEGWSRSWGGRTAPGMTALAIPNRARDLLVAYQRVFV